MNAQQRNHRNKDGRTGNTPKLSGRTFWLGHGWLILSIAATLVLAGKHLDILQATGCGPGGGWELISPPWIAPADQRALRR